MNNEEREKLIQSWHRRADAYESLIGHYEIFAEMAQNLIDLLEKSRRQKKSDVKIMDFASGTGLVSRLLVKNKKFPADCLYLVEAAEKMCDIARKNLPSVHIYKIECEKCLSIDEISQNQFDFILSNASMHLMSERDIYPIVSRLLKPNTGRFFYTLWYHSFDETAHYGNDDSVEICLNEALKFYQYPEYFPSTNDRRPSINEFLRSRKFLKEVAEENNLELESIDVNPVRIPSEFRFDFSLMNQTWLDDHLEKYRRDNSQEVKFIKSLVIKKVRELIQRKYVEIAFVNVALRRTE